MKLLIFFRVFFNSFFPFFHEMGEINYLCNVIYERGRITDWNTPHILYNMSNNLFNKLANALAADQNPIIMVTAQDLKEFARTVAEEVQRPALHLQRDPVAFGRHRDRLRREAGRAHVHGHGAGHAVLRVDHERQHARQRLHGEALFPHQAAVVQELAQAAYAVAAHLRLAAVGVDDAHADVGHLRGQRQDQTVRADAEVAVAQPRRQRLRRVHRLTKAVHYDKIIAKAVHLGKLHAHRRPSARNLILL